MLILSANKAVNSTAGSKIVSPSGGTATLLMLLCRSSFRSITRFSYRDISSVLSRGIARPFCRGLVGELLTISARGCSNMVILRKASALTCASSLTTVMYHDLPVPIKFIKTGCPLGRPGDGTFMGFHTTIRCLGTNNEKFFIPCRGDSNGACVRLTAELARTSFLRSSFRSLNSTILTRFGSNGVVFSGSSHLPSRRRLSGPLSNVASKRFRLSKEIILLGSCPKLSCSRLHVGRSGIYTIIGIACRANSTPYTNNSFKLPRFYSRYRGGNMSICLTKLEGASSVCRASGRVCRRNTRPVCSIDIPTTISGLHTTCGSSLGGVSALVSGSVCCRSLPRRRG